MLLHMKSLVSQMHHESDPAHEYSHTHTHTLIFLGVPTSIKMELLLGFNNEKCIRMLVPEQFYNFTVFIFFVSDKLQYTPFLKEALFFFYF